VEVKQIEARVGRMCARSSEPITDGVATGEKRLWGSVRLRNDCMAPKRSKKVHPVISITSGASCRDLPEAREGLGCGLQSRKVDCSRFAWRQLTFRKSGVAKRHHLSCDRVERRPMKKGGKKVGTVDPFQP
jgi:hypothetical protein